MQKVQPIRSEADVERMKIALKKRNLRDWALFTLGINTGLRISDMLKLKVEDIIDADDRGRLRITDRLRLAESKTGKTKDVILTASAKTALRTHLKSSKAIDRPQAPLFPSRMARGTVPITRWTAWMTLNIAAKDAGIKEKIGTHTMRKTFGYHLYRQGADITRIQYLLNHSSPEVTLAYIGITRDETDELIQSLNL